MAPSRIQYILENDIRDRVIDGAVVLCGNPEKILVKEEFGFAEREHKFPLTAETVIDIASVAKAMATVTSFLICRSNGLIDFADPFVKYL